MDPLETVDRITELSIRVLLGLVIVGGYLEWWYYGPWVRRQLAEKDRMIAECKASNDKWQDYAFRLLEAAAAATRLAEKEVARSE